MVNRETNFNRKKVNKLKSIRDKKKGRKLRKKQAVGLKRADSKPLTKKEEKRQKRIDRIYKELNEKNANTTTGNILKKKIKKRRNNKKKNAKTDNNNVTSNNVNVEMQIEK